MREIIRWSRKSYLATNRQYWSGSSGRMGLALAMVILMPESALTAAVVQSVKAEREEDSEIWGESVVGSAMREDLGLNQVVG